MIPETYHLSQRHLFFHILFAFIPFLFIVKSYHEIQYEQGRLW